MRVVYIDTLFLLNLAVNYLILLGTAKICSEPQKRLRIAAGALFGAVYAVLCVFESLAFLTHPAVKLCAGVAMVLVVFGGKKRLLRIILIFFAVSAVFGGAVYAVKLAGGQSLSGDALSDISLKTLVLSFAISYAVLALVFRRTAARRAGGIVRAEITHRGRKAGFNALRDTGNSLTDPLSGRQVMIADFAAVRNVLEPGTLRCLDEDALKTPVETLERLSRLGYAEGFRLVPYTAVGVRCGMLLTFTPDTVSIGGRARRGMAVALSPNSVSDGGAYSALVGAD